MIVVHKIGKCLMMRLRRDQRDQLLRRLSPSIACQCFGNWTSLGALSCCSSRVEWKTKLSSETQTVFGSGV